MAEFDESKHPRDNDGKFTSKDGVKEYRQNTSYEEILGKNKKKKKSLKKATCIDKNNFQEHTPEKNYTYKKGCIAGAEKGKKMSFRQADNGAFNPYHKLVEGYEDNCQTCVAVYVARRQGYNVRALPYLYSGSYTNSTMRDLANNPYKAYKDAQNEQPQAIKYFGENKHSFLEKIIQPGEIYSVSFGWRKGGFHIILAEKDVDGKLFLYDPQSNKKYANNKISKYFKSVERSMVYVNLTNVSMNEAVCDKIMKKVD